MDRAKDYIRFVIWFVGLSYMALWPLTVPAVVGRLIAPAMGAASLSCAGVVVTSLQGLCQSHAALLLSPGLHLAGSAAALWVTARLMLLLLRWLLGPLVPRTTLHAAWRQTVDRVLKPGNEAPPPRWVPPRRDFGLRGTLR